MLALTRLEIITAGLSLAGRPDLTSDARLWLNLFLEEQYQGQDYDWLLKTTTLSVSDGLSFPSDYRDAKSAFISDSNGGRPVDLFADSAKYDALRAGLDDTTGNPTSVWADHKQRKFYFIPGPGSGLTLELKYYYWPTLPTHSDSTGDSETVVWGLPYSVLIDYIKARAMEYNDDERQQAADQNVLSKVSQFKMNNHDRRAGSSKIPMGKSFKKRF